MLLDFLCISSSLTHCRLGVNRIACFTSVLGSFLPMMLLDFPCISSPLTHYRLLWNLKIKRGRKKKIFLFSLFVYFHLSPNKSSKYRAGWIDLSSNLFEFNLVHIFLNKSGRNIINKEIGMNLNSILSTLRFAQPYSEYIWSIPMWTKHIRSNPNRFGLLESMWTYTR